MRLSDRLRPSGSFGGNTPLGGQGPPAARLRSGPEAPGGPPSERVRIPAADDLDPGPRGVRLLIVIGVIAALVGAGYFWMARPRPETTPIAASQSSPLAAPSAVPQAAASATTSASPAGQVIVHVFGKVRRPGVVTLPSGSRISDAIKAAGGVRPGAATGSLNLARKLQDGEQVPVGVPAPTPPPGPSPQPGTSGTAAAGTPVDLNTATVEQLDDLPGVGPVLAQRILEYRTQHGGFRSVEQLQEVTGIGAKRFSELKPMVRV